MATEPKTLHHEEACTLYAWRSLLLLVWHKSPTADVFDRLTPKMLETCKSASTPMVMSTLSASGATMDAPTRDAAKRGLDRLNDYLAASVNVILTTGFGAAALRGALTGLSLLIRPKYPTSFVGSITEGAPLVAKNWPATDTPKPSASEVAELMLKLAPK